MKESLSELCRAYTAAREVIRGTFPMESDLTGAAAATVFASANKPADAERLRDCKAMVKADAGVFSSFRGNVILPLLAMLSISDDPAAKWARAQSNYAQLRETFSGSSYLALVALLLTDSVDDADIPALAERGKSLYRRMRKEHPFLTGQEDSVFAILLAESGRNEDALIGDMEACYTQLDLRFPKGDGLQSASHVLAMCDGLPDEKAMRVIALYDAIKEAGGKYGKSYELAVLAALAIDGTPVEETAADLFAVDAFLAGQKGYRSVFGFDRRTRMMHAAMLTAIDHARRDGADGLMRAAANQSAMALVAAQQAMMCCMIACSTASASAASH